MDILGIGMPEIILVLVIALIVVGPKRLPEFAAQIARVIRQMRGYATDVTTQMRSELDELTREYEQIRKDLEEVRETAVKDVDTITREVVRTACEAERTAREVDRTVREAPAIIESSAEPAPEKRPPGNGQETSSDDGS